MTCRLIEHIPDKHFKIIRYYGFLSNRRRGEMLPKVYDALEMESKEAPALPCYANMLKKLANVDPYECLICKEGLEFVSFRAGESREELIRQTVLEGQLRSAKFLPVDKFICNLSPTHSNIFTTLSST